MPRCASGAIASPTRESKAWWIAPALGVPPKVTCELTHPLDRLVDQAPLQHGSTHAQWSGQELATILARQTGIQLSRESVREV
jgi:hypothetical protein